MERRFAVHAEALIAILLACAPAAASPQNAKAKELFDRGIKAYTRADYAAAADAFGKSEKLEHDADTLFALAQSQRKLDRCDLAIPIYEKLLGMELPPENRDAVTTQLGECKQLVVTPKPVAEQVPEREPPHEEHALRPIPKPVPEGRAWWQDPVGDTLVAGGLIGIATGIGFIVLASSADSDKTHATSYTDYLRLSDRATTDGEIGVIGLAVGGACMIGGITWYVTHRDHSRVVPTANGVAVRF